MELLLVGLGDNKSELKGAWEESSGIVVHDSPGTRGSCFSGVAWDSPDDPEARRNSKSKV